ncbi:unnamed protein product [Cyprideis torosa]|uniref:Uncharacterized protein n=1 Tax=Cyprideis torosa TaxID=163714 RepID=A0A7R8W7R6_9CRUS|nr:unnamed protein product [Cyprideis torosa]CAG0885463.1 unnamed protein product [Cyprideis torosa]
MKRSKFLRYQKVKTKINKDESEEHTAFLKAFNKTQKKYGTTSTNVKRKVHILQHRVEAGDTIQGLSLKYNTTVDDIKRANKLWTNDSLLVRDVLEIPVPVSSNPDPPDLLTVTLLLVKKQLERLGRSPVHRKVQFNFPVMAQRSFLTERLETFPA